MSVVLGTDFVSGHSLSPMPGPASMKENTFNSDNKSLNNNDFRSFISAHSNVDSGFHTSSITSADSGAHLQDLAAELQQALNQLLQSAAQGQTTLVEGSPESGKSLPEAGNSLPLSQQSLENAASLLESINNFLFPNSSEANLSSADLDTSLPSFEGNSISLDAFATGELKQMLESLSEFLDGFISLNSDAGPSSVLQQGADTFDINQASTFIAQSLALLRSVQQQLEGVGTRPQVNSVLSSAVPVSEAIATVQAGLNGNIGLGGSELNTPFSAQRQENLANLVGHAAGMQQKALNDSGHLANANLGQSPLANTASAQLLTADNSMRASDSQFVEGLTKLSATDTGLSASQIGLNTLQSPALSRSHALAGTGAAELFQSQLNSPITNEQWGKQLGQRVQWLVTQGISLAEIQLNPSELGPLQLRIEQADQSARVTFAAQHSITREIIESHLPRLRDMFEEQGLHLVDVESQDMDQSGQQEMEGEMERDGNERASSPENDLNTDPDAAFADSDASDLEQLDRATHSLVLNFRTVDTFA